MAEPTERTAMPPQKRAQTTADPAPSPEPEETAERRTAASPAPRRKEISLRRRAPALRAKEYDGTNAVEVAKWLSGQNRACGVVFEADGSSVLTTPGGAPVGQGWVLPNLEVVTEQDLTTIYEEIPDA